MLGWNNNRNITFEFKNAHDLDNMTARAQGEAYVKRNLRLRMEKARAVVVLVGESTKHLYKYIRWELELALDMGLPIIVANLNETNEFARSRCPAIIRDECVVHVPFKMAAIRHALNNWPADFYGFSAQTKAAGARHYTDEVLKGLQVA